MNRNTILLAALLGTAAPALAQEPPKAPARTTAAPDAKTLTRTEPDGSTTTLNAKKEGTNWRIDLTRIFPARNGSAAEEHTVLAFPSDAEKDKKIDELFANPPADAEDWKDKVEDAAGVEFDFDYDGPSWSTDRSKAGEVADDVKANIRKAYEDARRRWREMTGKTRDTDLDDRQAAGQSTDRLRLHSGEVINGDIQKIDGDDIEVKTADGKTRKVHRQDIAGVQFKTPARAYLGVSITDEQGGGARVTAVTKESPAGKAGIEPGDVILTFAGQAVRDAAQLRQLVAAKKIGEEVALQVRRGADTKEFKVTFEAPGSASKK